MNREKRLEGLSLPLDRVGRIMHDSWAKTKRTHGFHGPDEPCTSHVKARCVLGGPRCVWYHADLTPWEKLPEEQKDINRHAFDELWPLVLSKVESLLAAQLKEHCSVVDSSIHHREDCGCDQCQFVGDLVIKLRTLNPDLTKVLERVRSWSKEQP